MEAWSAFFASCIHAPVDIPQFTRIAAKLSRRSPLPAIAIANLLYRPTDNSCFSLSTQSTVYTYSLLKLDLLDIPSILRALYNYSSFRNAETSGEDKDSPLLSRWKKSYSHEEVLMYGLSKMVTAGSRPKTRGESLGAIKALVDWLKLLTMAQAGDDMLQSVGAESESHNQETTAVKLSVGALLVAVSDTVMVNEVLKKMCHKSKPI